MGNLLRTSVVSTAFFLSGGCGLVYEILWTRYLADLTGGTALSQLIVLMVFMGGLSLGAVLVGRRVDRGGNALALYGGLEIGIGLYALLFPWIFNLLAGFYYLVGAKLGSGSLTLFFLKILLALLLIIAPSLAMGGTLPAVTRYLTSGHERLRRNISLLYGINSLGAVVGILAGGFFLVYRFGISTSMQYTGAFNLMLGLAALGYARFSAPPRSSGSEVAGAPLLDRRRGESLDGESYKPPTVRLAMGIAALAGFAGMALQVAWVRYFVVVLGASHSSFTIVVAAFIFGIGLGALLVRSRPVGRVPLPKVLAGLLVLISCTLGVGLFFYDRLPFEIGRLLSIINPSPLGWPYYTFLKFGACFALMLLPTIATGMILPVCVRIAERGRERVGRDVALIYAVNTMGALLGIGFTGQLMFRVLSLPRTLQAILFIYLGATFYLAFAMEGRWRRTIMAFCGAVALATLIFWRPWSPERLYVSQLDFSQSPILNYERFIKGNQNKVVIDDRQGPDALVTVLDDRYKDDAFRALIINGKPDASIYHGSRDEDMSTHVLLGHLPVLLHPAPAKVFVLGLGSGLTTGEVLKFPEVKEVTTAELASEVFEASKSFAADNGRYWESPRHRMVIEDGKNYLRLSKEKFDVISLEPSNVWQEGMAGLFSEEFFRVVKARLAPGGVAAQWLHTYMIDDRTVNLVLKTFSRVFPKGNVFMISQFNILMIGYDEQWQFDPENLERRFYQPLIRESQAKLGNVNPAALLMREVLDRQTFREYTTSLSAPINTLDYPILEQAAEYGHFIGLPASVLWKEDSRLDPDGGDLLLMEYYRRLGFDRGRRQELLDSMGFLKNEQLQQSMNFMYLSELWREPLAGPPAEALAYIYDAQLREIIMHPNYRKAPAQLTTDDAFNLLGAELLVWSKTASQLWTPEPQRLHQLYDRFAAGVDRAQGGRVARNAALSLARGRACGAALPFFRIAEAKGQLDPAKLAPEEIAEVFSCEAKAGEPAQARRWWREIEQRQVEVTPALRRDKTTLDIKLGGAPPPPVYGRLADFSE